MYNFKNRNKGVKIKLGLLCAFFAVLLCCLAISLGGLFGVQKNGAYASADNAKTGHITAPNAKVEAASARSAEALATAWNAAVQESIDNDTQVTFTLTEDWTAQPDATHTTSFGTGVGFNNGRIMVPVGANVILDLNAHTINRGLTEETAVADGNVVYVNGGKFELDETSGEVPCGGITGGADIGDGVGGGVYVNNGGTFTLTNGEILSNYALDLGGGVYVNSGTFIMNGGLLYNNKSVYGGGLCLDWAGSFIMNGGEIGSNSAKGQGGGVYVCAFESTVEFIMNGGWICNNTSQDSGGGVHFQGEEGDTAKNIFTMNGGEISGNSAQKGGGGVSLRHSTFIMSEG